MKPSQPSLLLVVEGTDIAIIQGDNEFEFVMVTVSKEEFAEMVKASPIRIELKWAK